MLDLIIKLTLAHLAGDFLLQRNAWVEDKQNNKWKSSGLYLHLGMHAVCLLAVLEFNISKYWLGMLSILGSHLLIDLSKLYIESRHKSRLWFFLDQLAHFAVIITVATAYSSVKTDWSVIYSSQTLLFLSAVLCCTSAGAILIPILMSPWDKQIKAIEEDPERDALPKAGKYIGMLERLLVFSFIAINQWAGVGFLLTAKSIFRFGDLSKGKDRKLTEYILIGTLLSFGLAIGIGLGYNYVLKIMKSS
ncbi:MAG: DUF3307 domain-containing protein [Cytophagales bacterium]|nr:DUF3307 domain-containing protein [Cytophagales bacterium]